MGARPIATTPSRLAAMASAAGLATLGANTFTGTQTFADGSTWSSSGITMASGKTITAQAMTATTLALAGATIGSDKLAVTGTANISGNITGGSDFLLTGSARIGSTNLVYWQNRLALRSPADRKLSLVDSSTLLLGGVIDVTTDGTFKFFGVDGTTQAPLQGASLVTGAGAAFTITAVNSVSPTSPNRTVTFTYGGSTYYIAAKTTND